MSSPATRKAMAPILGLYRQILRAHYQQLPTPMRVLGDGYAREEFRRHLEGATTEAQWIEFGAQWGKYLAQIAPPPGKESAGEGATARGPNISGSLDAETVASMSEEQREQLRRLKAEAQSFGRSVLEGADESGDPDADEASRRT
jgi:hypothetical protein